MASIEKIREMLNNELKLWDQPSVSVGIIKDGKIELAEGYGYADVDKKLRPDADTIYEIGSCSKAFTSAAAAKLVDMGKLDWDKPINEYLPWLKFKDPVATAQATTRDLLCHRTGLPRHDVYVVEGDVTRRGAVENLKNLEPAWPFRSHWCYQNLCFIAVGVLIEELSGMTWEEFVTRELLEPIGMTRTMFFVDDIKADPNHAAPYRRKHAADLNGYEEIPFSWRKYEDKAAGIGAPYGPAGSVMSTVNDMLKWLQFHLDNGKVGDRQIISEENMKQLHKPQMLMDAPLLPSGDVTDFNSYALGWFTESYRGHKMIDHGGNIDGFSAYAAFMPDIKLGVVALTNFEGSANTYANTFSIIDSYLGVEGYDWHDKLRSMIRDRVEKSSEALKAQLPEKVEGTSASHPLDDYVGTYNSTAYGDMLISREGDRLLLTYNVISAPMGHYHYDTFMVDDPDNAIYGMIVRFGLADNGSVSELNIDLAMTPGLKPEVFTKTANK